MLKHAPSAGGPVNGQLRTSNTASFSGRSIHLRPQQPLDISTSLLQTTSASAVDLKATSGGQRLAPSLLNIAPTPSSQPSVGTATIPINNSIGNNLHTYSNQQMFAAAKNNNTNNGGNVNNNYSNCNHLTSVLVDQSKHGPGPREVLTSLGLLCLVSLLLALLSLIFLLKISPNGREVAANRSASEDFVVVYDLTLALCALSLSLNLCCLLVCAIQFLFAVKLLRSPMFDGRDNKYLEKSSASRTCAVGGFFISIPIFLTGIILYTFNHFHSTPAVITSVLIGVGILFCGGAMVHNVFVWQREKTISYRNPPLPMISHVGPLTPSAQSPTHPQKNTVNYNQCTSQVHPPSITPVSPNHSHGSFNPLVLGGTFHSTFVMRPSTATPPTPKPSQIPNGRLASPTINGRESVSPVDMSNMTSTSLHELSTLV